VARLKVMAQVMTQPAEYWRSSGRLWQICCAFLFCSCEHDADCAST
jgi:hypothetical protein